MEDAAIADALAHGAARREQGLACLVVAGTERREALLDVMGDSLEAGLRVICLHNDETVDRVPSELAGRGYDADKALGEHSLTVLAYDDAKTAGSPKLQAVMLLLQAQKALKRTEERFRRLVEGSADAIVGADRTGCIILFNPAAERLFGLTAQSALGQSVEVLVPAQHREEHGQGMARYFAGGAARVIGRTVELPALRADGQTVDVELSLSHAGEGADEIVFAVIRDVTERKRIEQRRQLLEAAMDCAAEAVVITDADGIIQYVNPAFERRTGYARCEADGRHVAMLRSNRQEQAFSDKLWETLLAGGTWQGQWVLQCRDGSLFEAETTISPVCDASGRTVLLVAVSRDVTELAQLRLQLLQAQKLEAIGQLAAGIAHEINTPTQYIGDNLHFLRDAFDAMRPMLDHLPPEEQGGPSRRKLDYLLQEVPDALDQALDGVVRVANIVRAMKEFSHPGSEERTAVDLNHHVLNTITVARNEWKYVAEMETHFDPDLPAVPCMPAEINQVVLNLIINAAHAIGSVVGDGGSGKGTITVTTRRQGSSAEIRVADTGTGIAPEHRERIFDPFYTTKPVGKGTGQGLAIARSLIIDKHGGELEFETELGAGTTFIIRLPLRVVNAVEPEPV